MQIDQRRVMEEVTRTSIELLLREPFYSHFFAALNKEVVPVEGALQTMAVGSGARGHVLYIHPLFWDNFLTDRNHRYGVVKHEILHIVFKHTFVKESGLDRHLVNIAMDIVVNQYVDRHHLPDQAIFLVDFPELELTPDASWRYYYDRLLHLRQHLGDLYAGSKAAATFSSIQRHSHGLDRHQRWAEIYDQGQLEKDLLNAGIDNLIFIARAKTAEKSYGTLPAGLRIWLDSILLKARPLVDWRRVIRLFSASSSSTRVRNTLKRPSKRYGTNPGIKIKRLRRLLVAIDTSASIGRTELAEFFNEIAHLWRQGSEILIVECDAGVQRTYPYKGKLPPFVRGHGGTDFNPPIAFGNTEFLPDGLIYFTDGVAPPPTIKPRFPVLWVISSEGIAPTSATFQELPGRKARLNHHT
jgi:predicted metal-dependent peptidase